MQIIIERRDQYGMTVFHPVCDTAQAFARIAKTKTLTPETLALIRELGYQIEITFPETVF